MVRRSYTARVKGLLEIHIGENVLFAIDLIEKNGQTFGVNDGTIAIYDDDDTEIVAATAFGVDTGILPGSVRCKLLIDTTGWTAGPHYAIWTLNLADSQTRLMRQSLDAVEV